MGDNIKMGLKQIGWEDQRWMELGKALALVVLNLQVLLPGLVFSYLLNTSFYCLLILLTTTS
jgi:hypothetical protein